MKHDNIKPKHVSNRRFNPRRDNRDFAGQRKEVKTYTIKPDVNPKMVDLFQTVSGKLFDCEPLLKDAVAAIQSSSELRETTKKLLLDKIQGIFDSANDIVNRLGAIGKVV